MIAVKRIEYQGIGSRGEVVYAIWPDGNCVFTYLRLISSTVAGLERATSTINAAEKIIQAICRQEGVDQSLLVFYDLQTHLGYEKREGTYDFDRLAIDGQGGITWTPAECPERVVELFADFIGGSPCQANLPSGE